MFDYLIILAALIVFDAFWLSLFMEPFYRDRLGRHMPEKIHPVSLIPFYLIFAFAILVFAVWPASTHGYTYIATFMRGSLAGLLAYAAYDFTNQREVKGWTWMLTGVDLLWGACMAGVVSLIAVLV